MITLAKLKSSSIEAGKRIVKVLQFGAKTAKEVGPFGFDGCAPEDWTAIYSETSNMDEPVVIGYINRHQLAEVGESRVYSLGDGGELAAFAYCRASGVLELNGADFSAVRFQNLKAATDSANALINAELVKIQAAITGVGGVYARLDISTDLSTAESPTVKMK